MIEKSTDAHQADIYIAGPPALARQVCAKFCERGLCVSVTDLSFVYTYGQEEGVRVTLINYARFPVSADRILDTARELGEVLMRELSQGSFSVIGCGQSIFVSRRAQDETS